MRVAGDLSGTAIGLSSISSFGAQGLEIAKIIVQSFPEAGSLRFSERDDSDAALVQAACRRAVKLRRNFHARSVGPKILEIVVLAKSIQENVNDDIAEIHEDPAAVAIAFDRNRLMILSDHRGFDGVGDCLNLTIRHPAADHEVVGEARDLSQLEDLQIFGFLIDRGARAFQGFVPGRIAGRGCGCLRRRF